LLPQRSKHPREMVITPKASTSKYIHTFTQSGINQSKKKQASINRIKKYSQSHTHGQGEADHSTTSRASCHARLQRRRGVHPRPPPLHLCIPRQRQLAFTQYCYDQSCMVYAIQKGGSMRCAILPDSPARILQQCGQCRWAGGI